MKKLVYNNLTNEELYNISKLCFNLFLSTEYSYKPNYFIEGYEIDRSDFIKLKQTYYGNYANKEEQMLHDQMKANRRNVKVQNRNKQAFEAYINNKATDEFYKKLAEDSNVTEKTIRNAPKKYYEDFATSEQKTLYEEKQKEIENQNHEQKIAQIREKLKYIFDICINSNFDVNQIEMLTEKYSISPKTVYNYVLKYCELYANEEELNRYKETKRKINKTKATKQKSKTTLFIERLINLTPVESVNYLIAKKVSLAKFINIINIYLKENKNASSEELTKIYREYSKYINKRKEEKTKIIKSITDAINLVNEYVESNYKNYKIFASKKGKTLEEFETSLKITKKYKEAIYKKFLEKQILIVKEKHKKENKEVAKIITTILEKLESGRLEILDYYDITNLSFEELLENAKLMCKKEEYNKIDNFVKSNIPDPQFDDKSLLKSNFTLMSYGNVIEFNPKYNKKVIEFLQKKNIPVNNVTFLSAVRKIESEMNNKVMKKVS